MSGDLSWQERAACVKADPELFFPDKRELAKANDAIVMCFGCKVRVECKAYRKKTNSKYGIWGGEFTER